MIRVGLPPAKLVTIHKGHDPSWYRWERPDLSEFGIPSGAFLVGCAANARPLKGVHILVQAMHLVPDAAVHLLLAGELRDRRIQSLAESGPARERIHCTGFRDDAPRLMGATGVFAMPTLKREGLPRALIEAMAQGVPAVVTNVGGMPELVRDRIEGLIVPPADPEALAGAIHSMFVDQELRHACGRRAMERIEGEFHVRRSLQKVVRLYEEVLAED